MSDNKNQIPHKLTVDNRQAVIISGVKDVLLFDEKEVALLTEAGKLLIRGNGLHVKQIDLEKGNAELGGQIDTLLYQSKQIKKTEGSLLKRIFQ